MKGYSKIFLILVKYLIRRVNRIKSLNADQKNKQKYYYLEYLHNDH